MEMENWSMFDRPDPKIVTQASSTIHTLSAIIGGRLWHGGPRVWGENHTVGGYERDNAPRFSWIV